MKTSNNILLCGVAVLGLLFTSCDKWLDVNVDPENPTAETASIQTRLPWIEYYANYGYQIASFRASVISGDWARFTDAGGANMNNLLQWNMPQWVSTTPYQLGFVGAAVNIEDLYAKAMARGAYHYAGAAKVIKAYIFFMMTDLYGEMPYKDALGDNPTPVYDNGKTIFMGSLQELEEGIELLEKDQEAGAPALAEADTWMNGDVARWIKFGYFLKARNLNHLIKKEAGKYADGKYDAQAVLDALGKALQSNSDNVFQTFSDNGNSYKDPIWNESTEYSPLYSHVGVNWPGNTVSKMYVDNLLNFAGLGVEDPRADKFIPWTVSSPSADAPAGVVFKDASWYEGGTLVTFSWRRGLGVDLTSANTPYMNGGPLRPSFDAKWKVSSAERLADTLFVEANNGSTGYRKNDDILFRRAGKDDRSAISGTFYTRATTPSYIATYAEACFIKAEVLFRQNKKAEAFAAYKDGIQANIEMVNGQLSVWTAGAPNIVTTCPSFTPMAQADIDNFLANGIGSAADLTLGRIMTQKRLALGVSIEVWSDMRRYDFDKSVFLGWDKPYVYETGTKKNIPDGKYPRRWMQCSHETNYNSVNLAAIGSEVPGADTSLKNWNTADDVWVIPVWWDSDQQ